MKVEFSLNEEVEGSGAANQHKEILRAHQKSLKALVVMKSRT